MNKWNKFLAHEQLKVGFSNNSDGLSTIHGVIIRKLYVSNILFSVTEKELRDKFKGFGAIRECKLIKKPNNKFTCFAFITFESPKEATRALSHRHNLVLQGTKLHVTAADSWHQPVELKNGQIVWDRSVLEMMEKQKELSDTDEEDNLTLQELQIDDADCSISKLNDDCLRSIFEFLPLVDQLPLVKVCQRWKAVSMSMWLNVKTLDFTFGQLQEIILDDKLLTNFVSLSSNLTSISLRSNNLSTEAVIIIARYCKKLERIHLEDIKLKTRSLAFLARSCPNLKSFSGSACVNCTDSEMVSLMKHSRNLEEIALKYSFQRSGAWLSLLRSPLKTLSLYSYQFMAANLLKGLISVSGTLKNLAIVSCDSMSPELLRGIVSTVPNLTSLQMSYDTRGFDVVLSLMPITTLNKLTCLILNDSCMVSNNFLRSLAENCGQLKCLSIPYLFSVYEECDITESGLRQICKLTELTHLSMVGYKVVNDAILMKMAGNLKKLKLLQLIGSDQITDAGCASIISNCNDLEVLDIYNCNLITNNTIFMALDKRKERNQKKLKIICGGTNIDLYLDCSPYLLLKERNERVSDKNIWGFGFDMQNAPLDGLIYDIQEIFDLSDSDIESDDFDFDVDDYYDEYFDDDDGEFMGVLHYHCGDSD